MMVINSFEAKAQTYTVYEGEAFSVMFTLNSNYEVTKIDYSANGKWVNFKILKVDQIEYDEGGNGYLYTVSDNKNQKFTINYHRANDSITLKNSAGAKWELRLKE